MVSQTTPINGSRIASLCEPEASEFRTVGNVTLFKVTEHWPAFGVQHMPADWRVQRECPVPQRAYLLALCGFWIADDEIKMQTGVPAEEMWIECQVISVGFSSFAAARKHRFEQTCVTYAESLAVERMASHMIG